MSGLSVSYYGCLVSLSRTTNVWSLCLVPMSGTDVWYKCLVWMVSVDVWCQCLVLQGVWPSIDPMIVSEL